MASDELPSRSDTSGPAVPDNISPLRAGTRGSVLARLQTRLVLDRLQAMWPEIQYEMVILSTRGDRVRDRPLPSLGGKGVFTAELEAALRDGRIHLAVHSLKDVPIEASDGLCLAAFPMREDPRDVLVSRAGYTLDTLPRGAAVGTGSQRRAAQLLARRPDLRILGIRGNVDTRVRKALDPDGPYDAVVLAYAGLARMNLLEHTAEILPLDVMLPAPGQGILVVQTRAEAPAVQGLIAPLDDPQIRAAAVAERAFLAGLGGGCAIPVAAYAEIGSDGEMTLHGRVVSPDGQTVVEVKGRRAMEKAATLGETMAQEALHRGADAILRDLQ